MKNYRIVFSLLCFLFVAPQLIAQDEVPKELLLSSLNSVAHLKLETDQINQLMDYNKGFVDEIYEVLESDKEDKHKKKALQNLSDKRKNDLREFLGRHKTNKYLKLMEDELRPLGRRNHLLKQIAKS